MAYNFLAVERDQLFLLPPSLLDWLPEDHLAWFILDAVAEMDLDAFYAGYRTDGWGGAAHEPSTMVALLLYAYCQGVRSSRQIERACHVDVAFRVIAANQTPDHTTIARFRQRHEEALAGVFSDSLRLCAAAGMASVGTVALDGTKMGCPGSLRSNATAEHIEAEVQQMLAEAKAADAHDDALFGENRGDEPPAALRARDDRRRRFAEAKTALEEGVEEARAAHEAHLADRAAKEQAMGRKLNGRKPKDPRDKAKFKEKKANTTDPESKTMSTSGGFLQGYNAQAAVNENQVVVAASVTTEQNDTRQLHPMLGVIAASLVAAGIEELPRVLLADAGYCSEDALASLGPDHPDCYVATRNMKAGTAPKVSMRGPLPKNATAIDKMERKVSTKRGRSHYKKRQLLAEPVFGQIKDARGARRFTRRGRIAADSEWKLLCATHNLLKLYRNARIKPTVAPWARLHVALQPALA